MKSKLKKSILNWIGENYGETEKRNPSYNIDKLVDKILTEITTYCEGCENVLNCPEEECVLFRIEQIVSGSPEDSKETL